MMKAVLAGAFGLLLTAGGAMAAGDPAAGEKIFQSICTSCHAIGPGATNRLGPELNGVIGRKAGTAEGYRYSGPMKNSGLTWDEATFAKFIANPRGMVPGTKMSYAGLTDPNDIANITAYLESFNADGSKKSQ
jgi:cytochrome c